MFKRLQTSVWYDLVCHFHFPGEFLHFLWGLGSTALFGVLHGCRSRQTDVVAEINSATFAFGLDHIHQNRTEPS